MAKKTNRPGQPGLTPAQVRRVRAGVRRLLKQHGGPSAVAKVLGLTPSAVSQIDSEKNSPSFGTAARVAGALGLDVIAWLSGGASHTAIVDGPAPDRKRTARHVNSGAAGRA